MEMSTLRPSRRAARLSALPPAQRPSPGSSLTILTAASSDVTVSRACRGGGGEKQDEEGAGQGLDPATGRGAGTLLSVLPPDQPPGAPCRRRHRSRPPRAAAAQSGPAGPAATHPAAAPWPGAGRAAASCGAAEPRSRRGAARGGIGRDRQGRRLWLRGCVGGAAARGGATGLPLRPAGRRRPRDGPSAGWGSPEALPPTTSSRVLQVRSPKGRKAGGREGASPPTPQIPR